jgi:hypothetical protein
VSNPSRQQGAVGAFRLEMPALALFSDFAGTAKTAMFRHYRQTLQLAVTPAMLKPAHGFFKEAVAES